MSMISTAGMGRSPTRLGIASRVYRPRSALRQLSSDGVAEPRITGIRSIWARLTATSRALYRGVVSCLKLLSCSSSITSSPSRRAGAKTADRAPTTTSTSPEAMLCQWRCRSASLMWLCRTATLANRRRNRRIVCGVRLISGTSTIASRPRATTSSMAAR